MKTGTSVSRSYVFNVVIDYYCNAKRARVIFCRKRVGELGWYPGKEHFLSVEEPSYYRVLRLKKCQTLL